MTMKTYRMFAVAAPGLEESCLREIQTLDLQEAQFLPGGVAFSGQLHDLYRANLWLRTASRVLVRVAELRATSFPDFFKKVLRLPWGHFIRPETPVKVRATSRGSRLVHTGRIARTLGEGIDRALGRGAQAAGENSQLVLARFENDRCTLSVDSSGELLHRRGYRVNVTPAPLRETLAAGLLMELGWDGGCPLCDPLCGSGTILIEGALLASGRAPGAERRFSFMDWPRFRAGRWSLLRDEAAKQSRPGASMPIFGSDRDPAAIAAARANAKRAEVQPLVALAQHRLEDCVPPADAGLVLCNPPYGARLGGDCDLNQFYASLGRTFRKRFAGWQVALLSPDKHLAQGTGLNLTPVKKFDNGGLCVQLWSARL